MNTEASHGTADSSGEILCRDIALLDIFSDENQNCHNLLMCTQNSGHR